MPSTPGFRRAHRRLQSSTLSWNWIVAQFSPCAKNPARSALSTLHRSSRCRWIGRSRGRPSTTCNPEETAGPPLKHRAAERRRLNPSSARTGADTPADGRGPAPPFHGAAGSLLCLYLDKLTPRCAGEIFRDQALPNARRLNLVWSQRCAALGDSVRAIILRLRSLTLALSYGIEYNVAEAQREGAEGWALARLGKRLGSNGLLLQACHIGGSPSNQPQEQKNRWGDYRFAHRSSPASETSWRLNHRTWKN